MERLCLCVRKYVEMGCYILINVMMEMLMMGMDVVMIVRYKMDINVNILIKLNKVYVLCQVNK